MRLLLAIGCSDAVPLPEEPPERGPLEEGSLDDAPVEAVVGADPTAALFGLDTVHALDLEVGAAALEALRQDPYDWVPATVNLDGERFEAVGLRLKGHIGSYQPLDSKAAFKLDADRLEPGGRIHGLEKLNLHNLWNDPTAVRDRLAHAAYAAIGVPAPRVGWAWVRLNGEVYGLYALIEVYDQAWLDRFAEDPLGNLYDGDYAVLPNGRYPHCDFTEDEQDNFALDAGVDIGRADVHAVTAALSRGIDAAATTVDVPALQRYCAAEAWVGQDDGYCGNSNNYRVYFDPALDGRARLFAWDHEAAFNAGVTIDEPAGALGAACVADAACFEGWVEARVEACAAIATTPIAAELDAAIALVEPWIAEDPRSRWRQEDVRAGQATLREWVSARCGVIARGR